MISNLSEILTNCRSPTDQVRNEAELIIDSYACSNFGALLESCAKELADESAIKENRQLCATLIKNMILYQPKHSGKWEQLTIEIKIKIKNYTLSCLATKIKEVRKATAITVAGICKLEIPRGEWPGIIDILISTARHEDLNIRIASIITLGYISQELVPGNFSPEEVDKILGALTSNITIDTHHDILTHSIVAFLNFIVFAKANMEYMEHRDLIFEIIFNILQHPFLDVRVYAMQCLVEISRLYYDCLETHFNKILDATLHHMRSDDEKVGIQAYEFWCSVSDEEVIRCRYGNSKGYCDAALEALYSVMEFHLLNRNAEVERLAEDSWNNVKAASSLLHNLALCTSGALVDKVFLFIQNCIGSEHSKIRDSTILAFGSILNTNHKDKIMGIITGAAPIIYAMLDDKSLEVRSTVSWCLKKITEHYSVSLTENPDVFEGFMDAIVNHLNSNKKVVVQLCDCIHYLAFNLRPDLNAGQSSTCMSKWIGQLLETLLTVAFTKDAYDPNNNVALASFFAMGSVIDYAPQDTYPIISGFFNHIFNAFKSTLEVKNFNDEAVRYIYQGYIATVISACAVGGKIELNRGDLESVYEAFKLSFTQRQTVYEEGLMACSSLALAMGADFENIVKDFGSYLLYGLQQYQDASICRIAVNSTSDLIRAIGPGMNPYIGQLIPVILNILELTETDKYIKTQSFIVITDMFIYTREEAYKYYDKIMVIIKNAMDAATYVSDKNEVDQDINEYFRSLREHLLECITCIIHCLKEIDQLNHFDNYVVNTVEFAEKIVDDKYEPNLDTYAAALGILGDLCEVYSSRLKPVLSQTIISGLVSKLKSCGIVKYQNLAEWSQMVIQNVFLN